MARVALAVHPRVAIRYVMTANADATRVRLDRWLWAARFYKTRSLAAEAIDGGKVDVNGDRAKRSKLLQVGDTMRMRIGAFEHVVAVRALSEHRGPAVDARTLYEETEASVQAREKRAGELKLAAASYDFDLGRPSKKDRRDIRKLRGRE